MQQSFISAEKTALRHPTMKGDAVKLSISREEGASRDI